MRHNKDNFQKIAFERMEKLLLQADSSFREHPDLSRRYVALARNLSTKFNVRFNADQKRLFCKKCNAWLKEGINCRTRLEKGRIIVTCLECKTIKRLSYRKKNRQSGKIDK